MKKTRRIEVVSYTRLVTVSEGGNAPVSAADLTASDLPPPSPWEGRADSRGRGGGAQTPRRSDAFWLRDMLRLRR